MDNNLPVENQTPPVAENPSVQAPSSVPKNNIPKYLYFVIPSALIIAGLLVYIFLSGGLSMLSEQGATSLIPQDEIKRDIENLVPTATVSASPTGTPIPIIKGEETYSITQGKTNGPKMTKAVVNPHDPAVGAMQKFTLFVNHTSPVTRVIITLVSDNKTQEHELSLTTGTQLEGQWTGSWETNDTHLHTYAFKMEASDGTNISKSGIAIR